MTHLTRRNMMQGTLAGLAGAGVAPPAAAIPVTPSKTGFKLSELFRDPASTDIKIAKQIGVNYVITGMGFGRVRKEQYVEAAQKTKDGVGGRGDDHRRRRGSSGPV